MRTRTCLLLGPLALCAGLGCSRGDQDASPQLDLEPFAKSFHGTSGTVTRGAAIASGPDGDLFIGGTFDLNVDLGGGYLVADSGTSVLVAHLDRDGEHLFSGNTGSNDGVSAVAISDEGSLRVAGSYDGAINFGTGKLTGYKNGYVAGFEPGGKSSFSKALGGEAEDSADDVATAPDGTILVAARAGDDADFGGGAPSASYSKKEAVVAAYGPSGSYLWELRIPGAVSDRLSVAADRDGNVVVCGLSYSGIQVGDLSADPGAFVARINSEGKPMWVRSATSDLGLPLFREVAIGKDGQVLVSGTINFSTATIAGLSFGSFDQLNAFWLALAPDGAPQYVKQVPGAEYNMFPEIAAAPDGDVLVGMTVSSPVDFGGGQVGTGVLQNVVLARFTADGELVKSMELAGNSAESLGDLAVDVEGNPVITGWFDLALEIGGAKLVTDNSVDMFVARLDF